MLRARTVVLQLTMFLLIIQPTHTGIELVFTVLFAVMSNHPHAHL